MGVGGGGCFYLTWGFFGFIRGGRCFFFFETLGMVELTYFETGVSQDGLCVWKGI